MKFGFMKRVDYWVGRPICLALTLWHRLIPKRTASKDTSRILIIKPSELGAIILALPMLQLLRERYPKVDISFLTFAANKSVFDVTRIVPSENVMTLRDGSFSEFLSDVLKVLGDMRRKRFDVVIDLEFFSRFTAIMSFMSGAPKRIGFHRYSIEGVYRGDLFTHRVLYNPHQHVQQMYAHMITSLDKSEKNTPESREQPQIPTGSCQFQPSDSERTKLIERLSQSRIDPADKIYLIAPGEGRIPLREWPLENFIALSQSILQDPQARIVIIGLTDPEGRAEQIVDSIEVADRIDNWVGKTELSELLTLMGMAQGVVASDSGLAHLAALTPVKHYILFGPEHPEIFQPKGPGTHVFYKALPCSPCLSVFNHRNSACKDNLCLKEISVNEVYRALVDK